MHFVLAGYEMDDIIVNAYNRGFDKDDGYDTPRGMDRETFYKENASYSLGFFDRNKAVNRKKPEEVIRRINIWWKIECAIDSYGEETRYKDYKSILEL